MKLREAKKQAASIHVQETRLVKNNKVHMCRLSNGVVGFGNTAHQASSEAYARAARRLMRAVNSGRICELSSSELKELDRALRK